MELNPDALPRVGINQTYQNYIKSGDKSETNDYLKNQLQEARWFVKSLKSRAETLLKVGTCIVEEQIEFFEKGPVAMKPMVLADIAERVEMHESTISRSQRKNICTPHVEHSNSNTSSQVTWAPMGVAKHHPPRSKNTSKS